MPFDLSTAKPFKPREKGLGFLGSLPTTDGTGRSSTELSIGVEFDGKETEIPSLVSTLNKAEIDFLLAGNKPTKEIVDKAVAHAKMRMFQGKNVFAQKGEQQGGFDLSTARPLQSESQSITTPQKDFGDIVSERMSEKSVFPSPVTKEMTVVNALINAMGLGVDIPVAAIPFKGFVSDKDETFTQKLERRKPLGEFGPEIPGFKMPLVKERGDPTKYVKITSKQVTGMTRGLLTFFGDLFWLAPPVFKAIKLLRSAKKAVNTEKVFGEMLKEFPDVTKAQVGKVLDKAGKLTKEQKTSLNIILPEEGIELAEKPLKKVIARETIKSEKVLKAKELKAEKLRKAEEIAIPKTEKELIIQKAKEGKDITKVKTMETKRADQLKLKEKLEAQKTKGQEDIFAKAELEKQKDLFGKKKLTESKERTLKQIREEIKVGEAGERFPIKDAEGYIESYRGKKSTYPDYFKDKGYTQKETLNIIDKALEGKTLPKKQNEIIDDLTFAFRQREVGAIKELRQTKSGREFANGLFNSVKEDITSKASGIIADPHANLRKFLKENKMQLTDKEIEGLNKFVIGLLTKGVPQAERTKRIQRYLKLKTRPVPVVAETAVDRVKKSLDDLPRLLSKQKVLTSKGSRERVAAMANLSKKYSGEQLAIERRKLLAGMGEYEKADFSSIRQAVSQKDTEDLFGVIHNSDLPIWQQVTAEEGLKKILGAGGGKIPNNSELAALREVFPEDFIKSVMDKTPLLEYLWEGGLNVLNLPRAVMATADLSAPLRQGMFFIRRQKQFAPAFRDMHKYAFSEKAYQGLQQSIRKHPRYNLMKEGDLALTDLTSDMLKREEIIMSNLAEKPWVIGHIARGSNRAYTGFLNKLRVNVFDDLITKAEKVGALDYKFTGKSGVRFKKGIIKKIEKTTGEKISTKLSNKDIIKKAKKLGIDVTDIDAVNQIASFVNAGTGRGSLGKFGESIAPVLNALAFSPRLVASRIQLIGKVFNPNTSRFVRKELLKDWAGFLATGSTVLSLASLAGATVGLDPRSADFGKIKVGNTRYDVWGGFQQYARLFYTIAPFIGGTTVSSTTGREYKLGEEGYKPTTRADILGRAAEFKLSPTATFAWSAFRGKTAIGKEFKLAPEVVDRMIPMVTQDLYDLYRGGDVKDLPMSVAIYGVGVQKYGEQIVVRGKTASGKPTVKFRPEPSLGEDIVEKVTGTPITTIPEREQNKLIAQREKDRKRRWNIMDAKKEVLKTGKPKQIEDVYIYLEDGILKTSKKRTRRTRRTR